jgi:hypothetical protein
MLRKDQLRASHSFIAAIVSEKHTALTHVSVAK